MSRSGKDTMTTDLMTVYRASAAFVAAYHAFQAESREHKRAIKAYCDEHPERPVMCSRSTLDHEITVRGFKDTAPGSPVPDGLSRKVGREYLIPVRGPRGQFWRDEIAKLGKFPSVSKLFGQHGFDTIVIGPDRMFGVGVEDCGEHGVFVKVGHPFKHPSEHLTQVPLSEYYLAHEAKQAAEVSG